MEIEVYILFSSSLNQYYIGYTKDLEERISMHRNGV
ncbi:MAG: GIY-YIG nuclease family protein [Marinifilaceae bacterium]